MKKRLTPIIAGVVACTMLTACPDPDEPISNNEEYEQEESPKGDNNSYDTPVRILNAQQYANFKQLNRMYSQTWGGMTLGKIYYDKGGELTFYDTKERRRVKYTYSYNGIVKTYYFAPSTDPYNYSTDFYFFDENNRIYQVIYTPSGSYESTVWNIYYNNKNQVGSVEKYKGDDEYYYKYEWDSYGNMIKSSWADGKYNEPFYITKYTYDTSIALIPNFTTQAGEFWSPFFEDWFDPIIAMQGYFGDSTPSYNLTSCNITFRGESYRRINYTYELDTKGRILKQTTEQKDLYGNGRADYTDNVIFTWN